MKKRTAKIVFWAVSPFIFAGFFRLFFLVFYFIFGLLTVWLVGAEFHSFVMVTALMASLGVTLYVLIYVYIQYVKKIINNLR